MSAYTLKLIAIITMTLNHVSYAFSDVMPNWLVCIFTGVGGITFPIMAYFLTEGYRHTRDVKKYGLRLFLFALLSQLPYVLALENILNVLFTLLLGLIGIYLYDHMTSKLGFVCVFILLILVSISCDWQLMGVPMILCYHKIQNKRARVIVPLFIPWCIMSIDIIAGLTVPGLIPMVNIISTGLFAFVGCSLSIPLLLSYNGEKGRSMKYLFYLYYPAHLAVIAVLLYIL